MNKAIVKPYTHGLLKDGRRFQIKEFKNLVIAEDGSIHSGNVILTIDDTTETYTISALAENIIYSSLPSDIRC